MMKKITSFIQFTYRKLFIVFLFIGLNGFAQTLPNFVLTVTPTPETCSGNGALSFSTSGTQPGATVTFYVYKAPNYSTPISTTTGNSVTGLTSGNYRVVAIQSQTGYTSNSQTKDATIANNIKVLTFTAKSTTEICGNDGTVTVTVTAGTVNATNPYTLYNSNGTVVVRPPQSSNIFTGLAAGTYLVSVKDSCGQNTTQTIVVTKLTPNVNIIPVVISEDVTPGSCKIKVTFDINPGGATNVVKFPITLKITTFDASGTQIDQIIDIKTGADMYNTESNRRLTYNIPYLVGATYKYNVEITDGCGKIFTKDVPVVKPTPVLFPHRILACSGAYFSIQSGFFNSPITYTITGTGTAASFGTQTFPNVTNLTSVDDITIGSDTNPLPNGPYTITGTDSCGHTYTTTFNLNTTVPAPTVQIFPGGCTIGTVNVAIRAPTGIVFSGATLITYPAAYTGPINATVGSTNQYETFNVFNSNGNVYAAMNGVPPGNYLMRITDTCGKVVDVPFTPTPSQASTNGNVIINQILSCGSFSLNVNITGSNTGSPTNPDSYRLQYYNAATSTWTNVATLINMAINGSYTAEGNYRVVKYFYTLGANVATGNASESQRLCINEVLTSFTYSKNQLSFDQVFGFACTDGAHYNLYASAKLGVAPYTFQIVAKQGDPSFVPINPTSTTVNDAFFTNLTNGIYTIRVTDSCLNTKEMIIDLAVLPPPTITATKLCDGVNGSLSVQNNSYLNYSWTKGTDPTVLSTTSVLNFTPFNAVTHVGTYYVHITSNVAGSCINQTLSFTITPNLNNPNAGPDVAKNICDTIMTLNLNTLLDPTADTNNGSWTEITNPASGYLNGSIWSPTLAGAGTYYFQYTVAGLCSGTDSAIYTITVDECGICYRDPVRTNSGIDSNHGITLLNRAGTNNGNWPMIRKSAHTVLESNSKGFVITRIATADLGSISNPVEGMIVYDTTEKCLKLFDGTAWSCFKKATCP